MASTISPVLLSGNATGIPIPVAATATPGTLIHTATATSGEVDAVTIYASNVTGSSATLTIEWGSVSDPGGHLCKGLVVPANSAQTLVGRARLSGGVVVRAFSGTASAINITGTVERYS